MWGYSNDPGYGSPCACADGGFCPVLTLVTCLGEDPLPIELLSL